MFNLEKKLDMEYFTTSDKKDVKFLHGYDAVEVYSFKGKPIFIKLYDGERSHIEDDSSRMKKIVNYIKKNISK